MEPALSSFRAGLNLGFGSCEPAEIVTKPLYVLLSQDVRTVIALKKL